MIKLVPITDVKASEYNPRKNDEKRLALTEMSLRKLGFLLPIYAETREKPSISSLTEPQTTSQNRTPATRLRAASTIWIFRVCVKLYRT